VAEGLAEGAIDGVAEGAIDGVAEGAIDGVAEGGIDGVAVGGAIVELGVGDGPPQAPANWKSSIPM